MRFDKNCCPDADGSFSIEKIAGRTLMSAPQRVGIT